VKFFNKITYRVVGLFNLDVKAVTLLQVFCVTVCNISNTWHHCRWHQCCRWFLVVICWIQK